MKRLAYKDQLILPQVTYRELIPGAPLVLPQLAAATSGTMADLSPVYERVMREYQVSFGQFVERCLGSSLRAVPIKMDRAILDFLIRGDELLGQEDLVGDLADAEAVRRSLETVLASFSRGPVLALTRKTAEDLLRQFPPRVLMHRRGADNPVELLDHFHVLDVLATAGLTEGPDYTNCLLEWLRDRVRPEHFSESKLEPLVVDPELTGGGDYENSGSLALLCGRALVPVAGASSDLDRLWFFLTVGFLTVKTERYSQLWRGYSRKAAGFGDRLVNSLITPAFAGPVSAHAFFANGHHRELVERLRKVAGYFSGGGRYQMKQGSRELGDFLSLVADSYHLALTMADGTLVACSAWTWTRYRHSKGIGSPGPKCMEMERNWFACQMLEAACTALGWNEHSIAAKAGELMAQGEVSQDLVEELLGQPVENELIMEQRLPLRQAPARPLTRYRNNPILAPISVNSWESKFVLNAGALRLVEKVYLFYRAFGSDQVSRIGLAVSSDGFTVDERLPEPIYSPEMKEESMGCEDPRVVILDNAIHMLYTAYDGRTAQVAASSISVRDFLARRWDKWHRHGMVFPGCCNKDAVLFPRLFNGKYALYHRTSPSMWLTYADELKAPWEGMEHRIVLGPRPGMMWDSLKIGAGSQALLTSRGWLMIYHGVDFSQVYRLGVLLLDRDDPGRVLYRSSNPVLEPETFYEIGKTGGSWVPNVVFTCGAVPCKDKEMLDDDDEILVYYGCADSVIGVASGRVGDLLPQEVQVKAVG